MKDLDLNAFGVSEMNVAEMKATDGGCAFIIFAVAAIMLGLDWVSDGKLDGHINFK